MNASATIATPYRNRAFVLVALSLLVFTGSFLLVLKAAAPGNQAHWPAVLWILLEFAAIFLFGAGVWQYKKHRRAQPGYAPDGDD